MAGRRGVRRRRPRGWMYAGAVVVLLFLVAGLFRVLGRIGHDREEGVAPVLFGRADSAQIPETRTIVLFFGDEESGDLVEEQREVRAARGVEEQARILMEELIRGPSGGALPSLPPGTQLRRAFFEEKSARLYLDFSRELQTNHWGGSAGELLTIRSILGTVATNLPAVQTVQLLLEGEEFESIAGHVATNEPLPVAGWQEDFGGTE